MHPDEPLTTAAGPYPHDDRGSRFSPRWSLLTVALSLVLAAAVVLTGCPEYDAPAPETAAAGPAPAAPPTASGEVFGGWRTAPAPRYPEVELTSRYVATSDGVRLAVDVLLPAPRAAAERFPAVLTVTRYWRRSEGQGASPEERFFTAHGFAVVAADERGTGASFGTWRYPWTRRAIADYGELAAWAAGRPWSNGAVGGLGTSYLGTTAQLLAVSGGPAVRAVIPRFMELDVFTDIVAPGGIPLTGFADAWSAYVAALDGGRSPEGGPGVLPAGGDEGRELLAAALAEHAAAPDALPALFAVRHRDEPVAGLGVTADDFSVHRFRPEIEASGVPIYGWGSWLDAATADAVIGRFLTFGNPQRAVIGAWSHGGGFDTDPFLPADAPLEPPRAAQLAAQLRFLDRYLRGVDAGPPEEDVLVYRVLGEGSWKATATWPPVGFSPRRFYPAAGGRLTAAPPAGIGEPARDRYAVDFTASTGRRNRWFTEADGGDVVYPDRRAEDLKLLTYSGEPLAADLVITGHPVVHLELASTADDGAVFVYLEAVAPDGRVVMLTEGQLRLVHRTLRRDLPPALGPRPTFRSADARPLVPGEVTALDFTLLPTSARVPAGWRLRLAIAGHDAGTFARIPATGDPVLTVERSAERPSWIDLPVATPAAR